MTNHEFLFFAAALFVLWLAAQAGIRVRRWRGKLEQDDLTDLAIVVTASLTLLGLIVGLSFSMAVTRYNQRKDCEAAEANAIRTQHLRAALLPAEEAAGVRGLLKSYLAHRVRFYLADDDGELERIQAGAAQTATDLWDSLLPRAAAQQTSIADIAVTGVNDIWNSEGLSQAAWYNRIPAAGWILMGSVAICCNFLIGFIARRPEASRKRFWILPLLVSLSFLLIADIDNPRKGAIVIYPLNLERLAASLQRQGITERGPGQPSQPEGTLK